MTDAIDIRAYRRLCAVRRSPHLSAPAQAQSTSAAVLSADRREPKPTRRPSVPAHLRRQIVSYSGSRGARHHHHRYAEHLPLSTCSAAARRCATASASAAKASPGRASRRRPQGRVAGLDPPAEMLERQPYLPRFMAGGPGNPLGARAMYLGGTDLPHPRHQPAVHDRQARVVRLHPHGQRGRDRPLCPRQSRHQGRGAADDAAPGECGAEPPGRAGNAGHQFIRPGFRTGGRLGRHPPARHLLKPVPVYPSRRGAVRQRCRAAFRRLAFSGQGLSSLQDTRLRWSTGVFAASPHFSHWMCLRRFKKPTGQEPRVAMWCTRLREARSSLPVHRRRWLRFGGRSKVGQARRRTLSASSTGPSGCLSAGIAESATQAHRV